MRCKFNPAQVVILFTLSVQAPIRAAIPELHLRGRVEAPGGDVIRFSPDSSLVLTAGEGTARVWDAKTLKPTGKAVTHNSEVVFARFVEGGREVITGTDGGLRRWNIRTGEDVRPPLELKALLEGSTVSGDGRYIAGLLSPERKGEGAVADYEAATGKQVAKIRNDAHPEFVVLNEDGSRIVIVLERGVHERGFQIWDVLHNHPVCPEIRTEYDYRADVGKGAPPRFIPAAFSPDGKQVAICDKDSFQLYDSSTGRLIGHSTARDGIALIQGVAFTADGRQVIVFSSSGISGWKVTDATNAMPSVGSGFIACYDVSVDGMRAALVTVRFRADGTEEGEDLSVWDWAGAGLLCTTKIKDGSNVVFSPDGGLIAVGGNRTGETLVWELK